MYERLSHIPPAGRPPGPQLLGSSLERGDYPGLQGKYLFSVAALTIVTKKRPFSPRRGLRLRQKGPSTAD